MKCYEFALTLDIEDFKEDDAEKIFEVCDDCTAGVNKGVTCLVFSREAKDFPTALGSAIKQVTGAGYKIKTVLDADDNKKRRIILPGEQ